MCRKAGKKLSVLARLSNFMSVKQRHILLKTFIESQFGYCPLIWLFHNRRINNKINHLHERSLPIVYKDNYSSLVDLMQRTNRLPFIKETLSPLLSNYLRKHLSNGIMCNVLKTRTLTHNLQLQIFWETASIHNVMAWIH